MRKPQPSDVNVANETATSETTDQKIWFLVPDFSHPVGGVWAIYKFVDDLVASGFSAYVVHEQPGFRCTWFENSTPIVSFAEMKVKDHDLVCIPEISVTALADQFPTTPILILNQRPYATFDAIDLPPAPALEVLPPTTIGILTVSCDAVEYLALAFPGVNIDRIHLGIDSTRFCHPEISKERSIAFMPRRRKDDLVQVLRILERRGSLVGWHLYPIDNMLEKYKVEILARSAIFLSFNEREGFGLPPVEAMAARCVVVGFAGGGGREYMQPELSFPIYEGSIIEFVRVVEDTLKKWTKGERFTDKLNRAQALVAREYSLERQRSDLVQAISSSLQAARELKTPSIETDITKV